MNRHDLPAAGLVLSDFVSQFQKLSLGFACTTDADRTRHLAGAHCVFHAIPDTIPL